MEGKVSQIAEKLLKEGVEKGQAEKAKILESAEAEAQKILSKAKDDASTIISNAEDKAVELKKNAESEIKLAGNQAISVLKQKITNLVTMETVDSEVTKALTDEGVMAEYIATVLGNWEGNDADLELLLPEEQRASMEKELAVALKKLLKKTVNVSFSKSLKGGFQVGPADGSYKVTLSDEDFSGFFNEYLRPRIRTILFGE